MQPVDGLTATGAPYLVTICFGVLPQVLSNFISSTLLRFEINVRGATVLGFVGAGGIGKELISSIRQFYYADVSAILTIVILTVFLIDWLTELLRHRLLSLGGPVIRPRNSALPAVDVASFRARYPATFERSLAARLLPALSVAFAVCLALYALGRFDCSPVRLIDGFGEARDRSPAHGAATSRQPALELRLRVGRNLGDCLPRHIGGQPSRFSAQSARGQECRG